jgi:preprotein translocase subunit SecG
LFSIGRSNYGSKPKGGGLSSSLGGSTNRWCTKNFRLLDKSTWTLSAILIALILLSSLSFTGTLSDTDSKIIDNTEAAAPASPIQDAPAATNPAK